MSEQWPVVKFRRFLKPNSRPHELAPDEDANLVGMRWYGDGPFHREYKLAVNIAKKSHFVIRSGDIIYNKLFAWKGSFGVVPPELDGMFVSDKFPTYEADLEQADLDYLRWCFRWEPLWEQSKRVSTGSAAISKLTLNPPKFLDLEIPLPPLPEQRRIVARIEELAGRIAEAKGLQHHAVEEHAKLYASLRDQVFRQLHCKRKPIAELFTLVNGRAFGPEEWELEGRPIIRIQNLKYPGTPFNRYSGSVEERHLVRPNDVLFAWSGQIVSLGAHVWEGEEGILNQHIFKVVSKSHSLPGFVQEGFNFLVDEMASQVRGLEMFHIRKQELERIEFPDLAVTEQHAVVDRLRTLKAMTSTAVTAVEAKRRELDALLPSILDKAFRGEL